MAEDDVEEEESEEEEEDEDDEEEEEKPMEDERDRPPPRRERRKADAIERSGKGRGERGKDAEGGGKGEDGKGGKGKKPPEKKNIFVSNNLAWETMRVAGALASNRLVKIGFDQPRVQKLIQGVEEYFSPKIIKDGLLPTLTVVANNPKWLQQIVLNAGFPKEANDVINDVINSFILTIRDQYGKRGGTVSPDEAKQALLATDNVLEKLKLSYGQAVLLLEAPQRLDVDRVLQGMLNLPAPTIPPAPAPTDEVALRAWERTKKKVLREHQDKLLDRRAKVESIRNKLNTYGQLSNLLYVSGELKESEQVFGYLERTLGDMPTSKGEAPKKAALRIWGRVKEHVLEFFDDPHQAIETTTKIVDGFDQTIARHNQQLVEARFGARGTDSTWLTRLAFWRRAS
jgi:hypothetical protein